MSTQNQTQVQTLQVYTTRQAALAVATPTDTLIHFKRNKTSQNPVAYERCILIPTALMEQGLPDSGSGVLPECMLNVLKAARLKAAEDLLRKHSEADTYHGGLSASWFEGLKLDVAFVELAQSKSEWLTKEELQALWNASATRARMVNRPEYRTNKTYQAAFATFEQKILGLAGKATRYEQDWQDRLIAKLESSDLETALGAFLVFRIEKMQQPTAQGAEYDFDAL
jgi:hypothetical protein